MAIKQSPTLRDRVYNGTAGNLSKAHGHVDFSADAAATVAHVLEMPAGAKIFGVDAHHANLGAGTGVQVGLHYPDDPASDTADVFGSGATTSAGTVSWSGVPVTLTQRAVLTVTVTGGAATGAVDVIPEYVNLGIL